MPPRVPIAQSVRSQFPASAYAHRIVGAWKPVGDELRPAPNGSEGWTSMSEHATALAIQRLREQGFLWVNLQASGVANPFRDARIADLR